MKTNLPKDKQPFTAAAFTLMELTVIITVGILIAVMALTLFSFQLTTYRIVQTQNFLIHEAPQVNNTLNRIVSRANFFRLYTDLNDADAGTNAVIDDATVMVLQFNGTGRTTDTTGGNIDRAENSFGVIHFDNTTNQLNYYHLNDLDDLIADDLTPATPAWTISDQVADTEFFITTGVLQTRLTGPNGGEIIHSTTTQR